MSWIQADRCLGCWHNPNDPAPLYLSAEGEEIPAMARTEAEQRDQGFLSPVRVCSYCRRPLPTTVESSIIVLLGDSAVGKDYVIDAMHHGVAYTGSFSRIGAEISTSRLEKNRWHGRRQVPGTDRVTKESAPEMTLFSVSYRGRGEDFVVVNTAGEQCRTATEQELLAAYPSLAPADTLVVCVPPGALGSFPVPVARSEECHSAENTIDIINAVNQARRRADRVNRKTAVIVALTKADWYAHTAGFPTYLLRRRPRGRVDYAEQVLGEQPALIDFCRDHEAELILRAAAELSPSKRIILTALSGNGPDVPGAAPAQGDRERSMDLLLITALRRGLGD